MKNRYDHKWRGKRLGDMNKEELIDALIESNTKLMDCKMALVRFDYEFPLEKGEGVLSIHFEGEIIFLIYESQTTPGVHTAEVSLDKEYPPGSYSLGFRVDSETKSELEISNVSFLGYTDVEN